MRIFHFIAAFVPAIAALNMTAAEAGREGEQAVPSQQSIVTYYPHWVSRQGDLTPRIMGMLERGAIIGAHHGWSLAEIRRILDFPGKDFQIAWYAESNVFERDDPTPAGTPVAARINQAKTKQSQLIGQYGAQRFAGLVELDASREKKEGNLRGKGNRPADWLKDARAVKDAGFRYVAKSPKRSHIDELRSTFGDDFVGRVVFEDVTGGAGNGYRSDARAVVASGELVTLIIHSGAYG